jgi:CheY-like chemotaxis protein
MQKILIVDDEPTLLGVISRTLRKAGFDVLEASDGQKGMDLLAENQVDLIISDIFMPNVDGMEFTMRVKERLPDAKIIVMSGGGMLAKERVLEIASHIGATLTLEKPFWPPELLAAVNTVLGLSQPIDGPGLDGQVSADC